MINLSGRQGEWPGSAATLWSECVSVATAGDRPWRTAPVEGEETLREALGLELGVKPETLMVTSGVRAAAVALGRSLGRVLVETPGFADIPGVLKDCGCDVALSTWADMVGHPQHNPSSYWITSPCRNPDGRTISRAE